MKRTPADVRPAPLVAATLDLPTAQAVVQALRPHVSAARAARIDEVVARRIASVTLVLDRFHDPHNGGAALRSAEAFGLTTVHAVETVEPFVVARKAAQGAHEWVNRPGTPVVYCSATRALAIPELLVHVVDDVAPTNPVMMK